MPVWETYKEGILAERWKKRIEQLKKNVQSTSIDVGILENASSEIKTKMYVAEFGAPSRNVPARMPISRGLQSQKKELSKPLQTLARAMIRDALFKKLGFVRQAQIVANLSANLLRKKIREGLSPSLRDTTVETKRRKKFRYPLRALYATGEMYKAIRGKVRKK